MESPQGVQWTGTNRPRTYHNTSSNHDMLVCEHGKQLRNDTEEFLFASTVQLPAPHTPLHNGNRCGGGGVLRRSQRRGNARTHPEPGS